jgi:hypothetical protein
MAVSRINNAIAATYGSQSGRDFVVGAVSVSLGTVVTSAMIDYRVSRDSQTVPLFRYIPCAAGDILFL